MRLRKHVLAPLAAAIMIVSTTSPAAALGRAPDQLAAAELHAITATMGPAERIVQGRVIADASKRVVSYTRSYLYFDRSGNPVGAPVSMDASEILATYERGSASPGSVLAPDVYYNYLTLTVSVAYDTDPPHYYWDITGSWDWSAPPDPYNTSEDSIGVAWANGLSLFDDYGYGYFNNGSLMGWYPSDGAANVGTGWSAREWKQCCSSTYFANWGYLLATIYWPSKRYQPTDVVLKYFHTKTSLSYSLSFSASPSISITPTTDVWSLVARTTFTD
jgi:hypothetical protein